MVNISDLISSVKEIGPEFLKRNSEACNKRTLPKSSISDLIESKVLRACMPRRFGGFELPFGAHTDVAYEISKYCGSTGWVAGVLGSHNWWIGKYEPEAQFEIWEKNENSLIGAAFASKKGSQAYLHKNGYKISGEWMWCSGVEFCEWVSLMVPIFENSENPVLSMILLKKDEFEIRDVWDSPGLRATGSNNVIVKGHVVPKHRVTKLSDLNQENSPGSKLNSSSVYRLPMLDVFGYAVAMPTLGCAVATLNHYIKSAKNKLALDNVKIIELQSQQLRVAESSTELDIALNLYKSDLEIMWSKAEKNESFDSKQLFKFKRNCSYVAKLARKSVDRLIEGMGAGGITCSNPAYTSYSDTIAGASHRALSWDINGSQWGKDLFGLTDGLTEVERRNKANLKN
ncbi:MAG: hypothetical protein CMM49_00965 [Rhodospirillaceae bacterium]|nr:hypothetical protein [Rhodospirillaceae bacterium]